MKMQCEIGSKTCVYCKEPKELKEFSGDGVYSSDTCVPCCIIIEKLRALVAAKDTMPEIEFKRQRGALLEKAGRILPD